jgi:DNA invertase Pin-like site-specific DNA recombinase
MSLRLDGYVRVSRVGGREGEGYISPSVQREAISNYAAELDGEIVAWHQDEDYSGGNVKRPDFQATLERLRDGASDGIVVMAIDRFAGSLTGQAWSARSPSAARCSPPAKSGSTRAPTRASTCSTRS